MVKNNYFLSRNKKQCTHENNFSELALSCIIKKLNTNPVLRIKFRDEMFVMMTTMFGTPCVFTFSTVSHFELFAWVERWASYKWRLITSPCDVLRMLTCCMISDETLLRLCALTSCSFYFQKRCILMQISNVFLFCKHEKFTHKQKVRALCTFSLNV